MTSGGGIKKYIIDTCCFMSLDGSERQEDRYTSEQQKIIWNGIEGICSRITIIPQVKHELQKYYPEPLPSRIKSLIRPYAHHTRDPADPWIVAVAQHYGYVVVTDEVIKRKRKNDKDRDHIPDVCSALGLECLTLDDFILLEKLQD
jgi:hypothetical protein